ncbi:cytidine deaminase-like protein [Cenococcum geophilum 1.58]|uniref:cytidine deaminase-like protein n=1 Tax=Cenococcum geophilum 1.58 TaxID=794803 RepID=UPI00358EF5A1|nr:cytidine deaminase-like protein [Cenococcum geophilum 1.58]
MKTPQLVQDEVFNGPLGLRELAIAPIPGRLVALKTKDELRAVLETIDVYVIEVPAVYAGATLNIVKNAIPDLKTVNLQHLRRVVQLDFLPVYLQDKFRSSTQPWDRHSTTSHVVGEQDEDGGKRAIELRYLLIAPTSLISPAELQRCLAQNPPFLNSTISLHVHTIPVPAFAPTSAEQAAKWTEDYWSISYKNTNPYGPHPSFLARAVADIETHAGTWLALARVAGQQTKFHALGEEIGCVIIEKAGNEQKVIAVAGDARWCSTDSTVVQRKEGPGNVMAHAVMRAIGMVAKKRLRAEPEPNPSSLGVASENAFCDAPLTPIERRVFTADNIIPGGYLCVDFDIYVTHEPCVMCSMAMLHSRFRRCVFARRMSLTGGLTAEMAKDGRTDSGDSASGLGYGMFWRPSELNWKFLAWEWVSESEEGGDAPSVDGSIQA